MLQCHPHPCEFVDPERKAHCAFFMGLQRKQGIPQQEGQQFDIRSTVDEFRHSVNMYMMWKPGMEIHVSHVRRKQIPVYVFPGGVRPVRASRPAGAGTRPSSAPGTKSLGGAGSLPKTNSGPPGDHFVEEISPEGKKERKRKSDRTTEIDRPVKKPVASPPSGRSSPASDLDRSVSQTGARELATAEDEALKAVTEGPTPVVGEYMDVDELDIMEDVTTHIAVGNGTAKPVLEVAKPAVAAKVEETGPGRGGLSGMLLSRAAFQNGNMEELEVLFSP